MKTPCMEACRSLPESSHALEANMHKQRFRCRLRGMAPSFDLSLSQNYLREEAVGHEVLLESSSDVLNGSTNDRGQGAHYSRHMLKESW